RHANVDLVELRFCPAKRNRGRELDLDHIILAALHGMQRALLEYPEVRAGLILSCDRTFLPEVNAAIVRKAIRYRDAGIVGVDLELCPTSNLRTRVVRDLEEYRFAVGRLDEFGVAYTLNTDGPEFLVTDLPTERRLLADAGILDDAQLARADRVARQASFIP